MSGGPRHRRLTRRARRADCRQARTAAKRSRDLEEILDARRRRDGGARRSRPRDAVRPVPRVQKTSCARARAAACRPSSPRRCSSRCARSHADARRGQRRGERGRSRRSCDHAGGGDRGRRSSRSAPSRRSTPSSVMPSPTASTRPNRCRATAPALGPRGRARRRRRRPGDARPRRGHRRGDARGPDGADAVVGPPGGDHLRRHRSARGGAPPGAVVGRVAAGDLARGDVDQVAARVVDHLRAAADRARRAPPSSAMSAPISTAAPRTSCRFAGPRALVDYGAREPGTTTARAERCSTCLGCQAGCQGRWALTMALRMVRSLCMAATAATLGGLPAARRRW